MAMTLATGITRVRQLLVDTGSITWTDATITEGIRTALGEYSLAAEAVHTLNGLDGAGANTFPVNHETLLILGAAGYCVAARAAESSGWSGVDHGDLAALLDWGQKRINEFKAGLGFVFPGYLT